MAISQGVRRGGRAASARAWTVLVRAARTAGTKVATTATPRATAVTMSGRGQGERRRTRAAEEAGTGIGEQGSGQPSGRQPSRGREQGHDQVLGEQHDRDQARCAADGFEQSDASGLVGHPAADEDRDAGHGEQAEQPAADLQDSLLVLHHLVVVSRMSCHGLRIFACAPRRVDGGGRRRTPARCGSASFRFTT